MGGLAGSGRRDGVQRSFTMIRDSVVDLLIAEMLVGLRQDIAALSPGPGLAAMFLGGSYGRGDGGVVEREGRRLPYNDMDFFVFSDGMGKKSRIALDAALAGLAETWSERMRIDIDFAPARELRTLSTMPVTLMFQELREGHVLVWGDERTIARIPECPAQSLPGLEALRLLLNRGTGLLLAAMRLAEKRDDEASGDFIWRNLHKCALGCGDALLILTHSYDYSLSRRQAGMAAWRSRFWPEAMGEQLVEHYSRAVAFKAQPYCESPRAAGELLLELRQLWLASLERGLELSGCPVSGLERLGLLRALATVGGKERWWKNWLQNVIYGLSSGLGTGCFMPPQCWLLQMLTDIHRGNPGLLGELDFFSEPDRGLDWFFHRWRRFN
ncbi:MAG: hypothetical protein GX945_06015 [Lentisphaerae bacterium]|nr:hypothetical protein [Lentisphaerota bacterium]